MNIDIYIYIIYMYIPQIMTYNAGKRKSEPDYLAVVKAQWGK